MLKRKRRTTISDMVHSLLKAEVTNICPLCGKFERTSQEFTAHHINHDSSVSEFWNLIRICRECHDDLTENKQDGVREKRVKEVKKQLFRTHFGPDACNALVLAAENDKVTCSPVTALMLVRRVYVKMFRENILTVGPATNVSTFDIYEITPAGQVVVERLRLASMFGAQEKF